MDGMDVPLALLPSAMFCTPLSPPEHLIMCPASLIDMPITKPDRYIITKLRHLKALELAVPAVLWN